MPNEVKKEYIYTDSSDVEHRVHIYENSFDFAQKDKSIHDTKFKTKPTTFLKDAFKRFRKNKSSVAGGIILGILLVLSIALPFALPNDLTRPHPEETFLLPKLFDTGTGFWDGTERISGVPVDPSTITKGEDGQNYGYPFEMQYPKRSVLDRSPVRTGYVDSEQPSTTSSGGYLNLVNANAVDMSEEEPQYITVSYTSPAYEFDLEKTYNFTLDMLDEDVENYPEGDFSIYLTYYANLVESSEEEIPEELPEVQSLYRENESEVETGEETNPDDSTETGETETPIDPDIEGQELVTATLVDYTDTKEFVRHEEADAVNENETVRLKTFTVNDILSVIRENETIDHTKPINDIRINIGLEPNIGENASLFIQEISLLEEGNETPIAPVSWNDANANILLANTDAGYWSTTGRKFLYHGIGYVCDITYDSYADVYGDYQSDISNAQMSTYVDNGWVSDDILNQSTLQTWFSLTLTSGGILNSNPNGANYALYEQVNNQFQEMVLDNSRLPVISILGVKRSSDGTNTVYSFVCMISGYKYLGYTSMPRFLAGTDRYGYDLLKRVFEGLRNSLLIGICVFVICFLFGLVYGAICGYFGGNIDILLQRFCDLLSGVPRIVIMTLCILNMGSNFATFILAMCMTGWIGTASLTRTQFYRFRDREYTLASRTLGASNFRLIFKHILPNAMGTIITSAVLMIPSVIFSEATISYLGLGFQDIQSLGVILSENQRYLTSDPHLILFPSAIMALIMISFNLFGNGLRDAFNPSLKGSD